MLHVKRRERVKDFDPELYSQVDRRLILRSAFSYIEAIVFNEKSGHRQVSRSPYARR